MSPVHHPAALMAEAELSITAVYCRLPTAARLNPDSRLNALTLQAKSVVSAVAGALRIFDSLPNLAPFAVVNDGHCVTFLSEMYLVSSFMAIR